MHLIEIIIPKNNDMTDDNAKKKIIEACRNCDLKVHYRTG
jgi:hypothetical protein